MKTINDCSLATFSPKSKPFQNAFNHWYTSRFPKAMVHSCCGRWTRVGWGLGEDFQMDKMSPLPPAGQKLSQRNPVLHLEPVSGCVSLVLSSRHDTRAVPISLPVSEILLIPLNVPSSESVSVTSRCHELFLPTSSHPGIINSSF